MCSLLSNKSSVELTVPKTSCPASHLFIALSWEAGSRSSYIAYFALQ